MNQRMDGMVFSKSMISLIVMSETGTNSFLNGSGANVLQRAMPSALMIQGRGFLPIGTYKWGEDKLTKRIWVML